MKKSVSCLLTKKVRAPANIILGKLVCRGTFLIIDGVCPENIAEETLPWRFLEPLQVFQIIYGF